MNLNPQFTYDPMGNKIGVFLTIEEFETLTGTKATGPVEPWEKDLISQRMAEFRNNFDSGISWEDYRRQMREEDGSL